MSQLLDDIVSNKVSLDVALQRLLVIANKTGNQDLANWCTSELNGYRADEEIPDYRKFKSRSIVYSGLNGRMKVSNASIGLGYLSEETLSMAENFKIRDGIRKIQEYASRNEPMYLDLTFLAPEIYKNTDGAVSCLSVLHQIQSSIYSQVESCLKTRIINLICLYEAMGINFDKADIKPKKFESISSKNYDIYKTIVVDGETFTITPKQNKIFWNILNPIISAIISGVIVGIIVYFITSALN